MLTFYILVEHDKIFLYQKDKSGFVNQYINGNEYIEYSSSSMKNDIDKLINVVLEEFNLVSSEEIGAKIILNKNDYSSNMLTKVLKNSNVTILDVFDLSDILFNVIINRHNNAGINFDGVNYVIINNKISQKNFSLLADTLSEKDLMKSSLPL